MKIAGSFFGASDVGQALEKFEQTTIDYLHVDIADQIFVSNSSHPLKALLSLLNNYSKPLDVHLMVQDIDKYVTELKILSPEYITFHLEATDHVDDIIQKIKSFCKVGISIKPSTPIDALMPYLKQVDLVLIMTVEPGFSGQTLLASCIPKINKLIEIRQEKGFSFQIEADGGINDETIKKIRGSDIAVVGSFITSHENYQEQIHKLKA